MLMERMQKEHNGIESVKVLRAKVDTIKAGTSGKSGEQDEIKEIVAQAYLSLGFADSSREEIVVPMVFKDDVWYLR
jgi:hypothetical protein